MPEVPTDSVDVRQCLVKQQSEALQIDNDYTVQVLQSLLQAYHVRSANIEAKQHSLVTSLQSFRQAWGRIWGGLPPDCLVDSLETGTGGATGDRPTTGAIGSYPRSVRAPLAEPRLAMRIGTGRSRFTGNGAAPVLAASLLPLFCVGDC